MEAAIAEDVAVACGGKGSPPALPDISASRLAVTALAIALSLLALGLVMVYSTTALAGKRIDDPAWFRKSGVSPGDESADPSYFLRRQALWAVLGLGALVLAWQTDYRALVRQRARILAVVLVLLAAVLAKNEVTHAAKGARRWFELGAMKAQPSELAKIAIILFVAGHCAEPGALSTFRRAAPAFAALGATVALIAVEPDFGTAAFVATLGALILLVGGVRLHHAGLLGLPAVALGAIYAAARFDHVRTRIQVFLDPMADPLGKGFQIRQALIALGSGGPVGAGIGESRQKLFFLPDDHTDFILAIVGEEMGLVGTLLVVALFAAFVLVGLRIAFRAPDRLGFLVGLGVTAMIGLQGAMNVAVVTASMPTKGISLPFVSYGGSSLLVAMAAVGMLLNVAMAAPEPPPRSAPRNPPAREGGARGQEGARA
jgi:cell division protein FtsW